MKSDNRFRRLFGNTPIIGMIHLAGKTSSKKVKRALNEIKVFEQQGINGALIENYHGDREDVVRTLEALRYRNNNLVLGVNILPNEYQLSLPLTKKYGCRFVQLDYISGNYGRAELDFNAYDRVRQEHPGIVVLGGVWPKYYNPVPGSSLEEDLKQGMERADAIVVTGSGTGMSTPLDKIKEFRRINGDFPLIVGAGLKPDNAYEQLMIANGAIVGSGLKIGNCTNQPLDINNINDLMRQVRKARRWKMLGRLIGC